MKTPQKQSRKSYLIKPDFQWRMIAYAAVLSAMILLLVYLANNYFISSLGNIGLEAGLPPDHVFFRFLAEQSSILDSIFLAIAAGVNMIVIFGGLWLSNRIAGPIYRVETCLKQFNQGETVEKVSFRKSDFFSELVQALNELIDNQNSKKTK